MYCTQELVQVCPPELYLCEAVAGPSQPALSVTSSAKGPALCQTSAHTNLLCQLDYAEAKSHCLSLIQLSYAWKLQRHGAKLCCAPATFTLRPGDSS